MTNYSAQELSRMQREAKARVVEMQNRSRLYAAQMNRAFTGEAQRTEGSSSGKPSDGSSAERGSTEKARENGAAQEKEERQGEKPENETSGGARPTEDGTDRLERLFLLTLFAALQGERGDDLLPLLVLTLL